MNREFAGIAGVESAVPSRLSFQSGYQRQSAGDSRLYNLHGSWRGLLIRGLLLAISLQAICHAQEVVSYRAMGHLDAYDGTIEFWLRLDVDAVKPDGSEVIPYYLFFNLTRPGDPSPRATFSYTRLNSPNHYLTSALRARASHIMFRESALIRENSRLIP